MVKFHVRYGVVVFPGSNCDRDTVHVLTNVLGQSAVPLWHQSTDLSGVDCVILPGGFAHGDYLRAGAIARFSPVMSAVERFAHSGGLVLGICNGFQVLVEAGLLPGAMRQNASLRFVCRWVDLRVDGGGTPFVDGISTGRVLRMPVAHGEGSYFADETTLGELHRNGQVILRYCDPNGELTPESNPNGAVDAIAGIRNAEGNVFGLMPHPERASEPLIGGTDGRLLFEAVEAWARRNPSLVAPAAAR